MTLVTIGISLHNNLELTQQCLNSFIKNINYKDYELIIVDGASTDGTQNWLLEQQKKKIFPSLKLLFLDKPWFPTRSINLAIKNMDSKSKYFCYCDNDIIFGKNWLRPLIKTMEKNLQIGGCSPVICNLDWSPNNMGRNYPFIEKRENVWFDDRKVKQFVPVVSIIGACSLFRWVALESIKDEFGYWDERFFFYAEDTDVSIRLWKKDYQVVIIPQSKVIHLASTEKYLKNIKRRNEQRKIFKEHRVKYYGTSQEIFWRKHTMDELDQIRSHVKPIQERLGCFWTSGYLENQK